MAIVIQVDISRARARAHLVSVIPVWYDTKNQTGMSLRYDTKVVTCDCYYI